MTLFAQAIIITAIYLAFMNLLFFVFIWRGRNTNTRSQVVFDSGLAISDITLSMMVYREPDSEKAYLIMGNAEIDRFAAFEMTTWAVLGKWFEEHEAPQS